MNNEELQRSDIQSSENLAAMIYYLSLKLL